MKLVPGADAADFAQQLMAALTPFFIIRCRTFGFTAAGENEVADFQIRHGTAV